MNISIHPTINAFLNAGAAVFLLFGFSEIKKGNRDMHKKWMVAALCMSFIFLVSYLLYHYNSDGPTRYHREGILRGIYFFILLTHTPLAALIPPISIVAVYFALTGKYESHVKIVKWLLPTWLYVSVTGVLIYLMLYIF